MRKDDGETELAGISTVGVDCEIGEVGALISDPCWESFGGRHSTGLGMVPSNEAGKLREARAPACEIFAGSVTCTLLSVANESTSLNLEF
mmetsp:Transcript_39418/g.71769  ORF Transcript_39418/g.71769 Transcript_39418/m.71769 type:complete len:90 (-) Transcript_39418:12-281(-)